MTEAERYWEDFYGDGRGAWSGNPNALLVEEATGLAPGRALDLGCGQGDDAIWLAARGWRVTAVDVSANVLARGAERAAAAGVAEAIAWERHDLAVSFPAGRYDLVCSAFLHSPVDLPRERILRSAAAAVEPGGTLLVIGHAGHPPWQGHDHDHHDVHFPSPQEVLDDLALDAGAWEVRRSAFVPGTRTDSVVNVRRLGA